MMANVFIHEEVSVVKWRFGLGYQVREQDTEWP